MRSINHLFTLGKLICVFYNPYLCDYLLSFLDIATTIQLACVSVYFHHLITQIPRYIALIKCKSVNTIYDLCKYGSLDLIQWYIQSYPNKSYNKNILLTRAAKHGCLDIIDHLAKIGVDIHRDRDNALVHAAECGHLDVVQYLVEHDADIHTDRDYALRASARNNHKHVTKYLIQQGANIK
jgi:ankyrin repeat protein